MNISINLTVKYYADIINNHQFTVQVKKVVYAERPNPKDKLNNEICMELHTVTGEIITIPYLNFIQAFVDTQVR